MDGFFDHSTGKGWVKERLSYYDDALRVKNNQVIPVIVETLGGIGRRGHLLLKFNARRAADLKRGRDSTRYSRHHRHTSYRAHHSRAISSAAVFANAEHIHGQIHALKHKALARRTPCNPTIGLFIDDAMARNVAQSHTTHT